MADIKLYNGDCLEIMKSIPNGSVDLVLTDPPYGMNYQSNHRKDKYKKIQNDDNLDFLDKYFQECYRIMNDDTAIYSFCSWHKVDVFKQVIEKYFNIKNIIVWEKNNTSMGDLKCAYASKYEFVIYANKGKRELNGFRYADIIKAKRTGNNYHPTEKPVDLLEMFINNSSSIVGGGTSLTVLWEVVQQVLRVKNLIKILSGLKLRKSIFK